jgi:hypothetical protein
LLTATARAWEGESRGCPAGDLPAMLRHSLVRTDTTYQDENMVHIWGMKHIRLTYKKTKRCLTVGMGEIERIRLSQIVTSWNSSWELI